MSASLTTAAASNVTGACVYRCYSGDGELLYVGATSTLRARLAHHSTHSSWAADVARVETDRHDLLHSARAAESVLIARHRPRWNIHGRGPRATWGLADYVEVAMAIDARRHIVGKPRTTARQIRRLLAEMSIRFPDVARAVIGDLRPHLAALSEAP